jgi:PilZ domain
MAKRKKRAQPVEEPTSQDASSEAPEPTPAESVEAPGSAAGPQELQSEEELHDLEELQANEDIPDPAHVEEESAELTDPVPDSKGLSVSGVVQFRETADESWKEATEIRTISKNGAGLMLTREVPVGRIVSLVLDMPDELRLYDHDIASYLMFGVVQNCVSMDVGGEAFYHVGVAFIGKDIPEAFQANPKQCYRITGLNPQGLWEVVESVKPFQARKHLRFWSRFEITINIRDEKTRTSRRRNVFTRDVSGGGMSVFGPLDAKIGDRVKIMSPEYEFYSMATVRNRTENEEDEKLSLIHFEFDEADFPVERLATPVDNREEMMATGSWEDGEVTQF